MIEKDSSFHAMEHGEERQMSTKTGNKMMTLADAQTELERQGLVCDYKEDDGLVGALSECRWTLNAKMDVMIFVFKVTTDNGVLTRERIEKDLNSIPTDIAKHLETAGSSCPPFGFGRARQAMVIYYADSIEPAALSKINSAPKMEWCSCFFLAAQDASSGASHYLDEDKTPYWGRAFYPELRWRAGRLTGRKDVTPDGPPGLPRWITFVNILSPFYLICMSIFYPFTIYVFFGFLGLHLLVATMVRGYRTWRLRKADGHVARGSDAMEMPLLADSQL